MIWLGISSVQFSLSFLCYFLVMGKLRRRLRGTMIDDGVEKLQYLLRCVEIPDLFPVYACVLLTFLNCTGILSDFCSSYLLAS